MENIFESLDAFRRHCGAPSRSLEGCPICSKLPDRCVKSDDESPRELEQLVDFIAGDVKRCPICRRLYLYESTSFGNDIYTGNDSTWSFERCDTDVLFDLAWCVKQRISDPDVSWVSPDRFFPNHALVSFGSNRWGALDHTNRLVMLDRHDAIAQVIDCDPPRVTGDLELAKRYAIFIDERENPEVSRPGRWDFIVWNDRLTSREQQQIDDAKTASGILLEMPCVATRDGDRVIVRSWVTSKKRLICRVITVQPDGHYIREDAVIAMNLPMRF